MRRTSFELSSWSKLCSAQRRANGDGLRTHEGVHIDHPASNSDAGPAEPAAISAPKLSQLRFGLTCECRSQPLFELVQDSMRDWAQSVKGGMS